MPDSFPESPYYRDRKVSGAALLTGHDRYAGWFRETDHPRYHARVASYRELTERLNAGPPPPPLPSIGTQGLRFARAMARQARAKLVGAPTRVSEETQKARLEICRAPCEFYRDERCRHKDCGCRLGGILNKTAMATERCPIGKWA
jgi:hypothetical protein